MMNPKGCVLALALLCDFLVDGDILKAGNVNASVIFTGKVISISEDSRIPRAGGFDSLFRARVQVLHVFKGQAGPQIDFLYLVRDSWVQMQWPVEIEIRKDQRYRFFAERDITKNGYTGSRDDVELLGPKESDSIPPLSSDDAIAVAQEYMRSNRPDVKVFLEHANVEFDPYCNGEGAAWGVEFPGPIKSVGPVPKFLVVVHMDRTIDSDTTRWLLHQIK